jgi:hypothetical protein
MTPRSRNLLIHDHRDGDRRCTASIILQRGIAKTLLIVRASTARATSTSRAFVDFDMRRCILETASAAIATTRKSAECHVIEVLERSGLQKRRSRKESQNGRVSR